MTELTLFNSLTRQLEPFAPVHPGEARVYTCGPTVYNYPHIGNMRAYVFADVLGRTLSFKGYKLTHVINITDVGHLTDDADAGEDKLEKAAQGSAQSIWEIAEHYKHAYWADVNALNIRQPAQWTVATDYVPQMIEFARGIADKHCYELESGLYFDISTVADYGRLARAVTEDGVSRIDPVAGKRHPADFAIWRKTPPGEKRQMEWDSPWGRGAPGWHLECSVMSGEVLGFPFDIHTGGIDHREIHHPCEIAQNQAHCHSDASGATVWMHNNFLVERSGKMSKSSGEFLRLQLLIDKGYHPLAYRMMCLQAHYRSELEFSWEGLGAALVRLKRLIRPIAELASYAGNAEPVLQEHFSDKLLEKFSQSIGQDLNTPEALTYFEALALNGAKSVLINNPENPKIVEGICAHRMMVLEHMDQVLGLKIFELSPEDLRIRPKSATITEEGIKEALERRAEARKEKNYLGADLIRKLLLDDGVEVMDGDPSFTWEWKLG